MVKWPGFVCSGQISDPGRFHQSARRDDSISPVGRKKPLHWRREYQAKSGKIFAKFSGRILYDLPAGCGRYGRVNKLTPLYPHSMKLTCHRSTVPISAAASRLATGFLNIVPTAKAGQVDPRLDGQWAGVETFMPPDGHTQWNNQIPQIKTIFFHL